MTSDPWGIDPGYADIGGEWRATPDKTRHAILQAMRAEGGAPPPAAPVKVIVAGQKTGLRGSGELHLEDGRSIAVEREVPSDLPIGYHDFHRSKRTPIRLIVAPPSCYLPEGLHLWGWAVQLYAVRSAQSWGIGDLADLRALAEWSAAELGAGIVMINPLGASSPGVPQQNSPYYPCTRRFRNPIYLRIEDAPELAEVAAAARALNAERRIDRNRVIQLKRQALTQIWRNFKGDPRCEEYVREQGEPLRQFALFSILSEHFHSNWQEWPDAYRNPNSREVQAFAGEHADGVRFHQWLQWLIDDQLQSCSEHLAIMQDLPVGVDPSGADAWVWQDVIATGMSVGAPPDPFATEGQNWGLPPFDPHALRAARYEPFIETIRAVLRHAGALRVDHAMGLFRLFWIPNGMSAAEGAYVRYPVDDLLGILALESHRAHAIIIAEDLGTVEDGVREKLAACNILSSRVMWFEDGRPSGYPERTMASITTHDLPTMAGIWSGSEKCAPDEEGANKLREKLQQLTGVDPSVEAGEVIARAYQILGEAPSIVVTASLDDAIAVEERPNMPGTVDEYPNWSLALPKSLEELQSDPLPRAVAAALGGKGRAIAMEQTSHADRG